MFKYTVWWCEIHFHSCAAICTTRLQTGSLRPLSAAPSPSPHPGTCHPLGSPVNLTAAGTLFKWNCTVSVFLCLAYSAEHNALASHGVADVRTSFLFKTEWCSMVRIDHSLLLFICRWLRRLLPSSGHRDQCCWEHGVQGPESLLSVSGVETQKRSCWIMW